MASTRKLQRIPVASHGLHKHEINQPVLSTANFFQVAPVYVQHFRKGESLDLKGALFSRTNPLVNAAMLTGRYNFKAFYVPYYMFCPWWYHFDEGVPFVMNGQSTTISSAPYFSYADLTSYFINDVSLVTVASSSATADIVVHNLSGGQTTTQPYVLTDLGAQVLKILNGLGYSPTWTNTDTRARNGLAIIGYVKAFYDYIFPTQYVGNSDAMVLDVFCGRLSTYTTIDVQMMLNCLKICSYSYYDDSVFDSAWDNPVAGDVLASQDQNISILDITNNTTGGVKQGVSTQVSNNTVLPGPSSQYSPTNGTPHTRTTQSNAGANVSGAITQYVIESLQKLNTFIRRHQLAGGRLIDRFLVSRGVPIDNSVSKRCFFLGQKSVEIRVQDVENNSDTNLGELAGKALASNQDDIMSFKGKFDDDGVFIVVATAIPDCSLPVQNDPFNFYVDQLDFLHSDFDKLGPELIPSLSVFTSMSGTFNYNLLNKGFGFWSRYAGYVCGSPRLMGDFVLTSRGANDLRKYHTFRVLNTTTLSLPATNPVHSYDWLRTSLDQDQYNRLFFTGKVDNLFLYLRWFGSAMQEKLPLSDSIDWDDDEYNRKVEIVNNGSRLQ